MKVTQSSDTQVNLRVDGVDFDEIDNHMYFDKEVINAIFFNRRLRTEGLPGGSNFITSSMPSQRRVQRPCSNLQYHCIQNNDI